MLQLSLALSRPSLVAAAVLAAATSFWSDEMRISLRTQTVHDLAAAWFAEPDDLQRFARSHSALGPNHRRVVLGNFIALFGHDHSEDFPAPGDLAAIEAPVLLVHGDRDHLFAPEIAIELSRKLEDAELCVLPDTGHWPASEQPEAFNLLVRDFLARRYREGHSGRPV
ncbi:MAG: hypothetical protein AVDCRST_MAG48-2586 [uncultured Friedmanniella sp.]|uniref:AB hydrolase-1 domain-containing protein n=1 Tax=uncultured Friedmanniella sp. TaxID=335381 RepID=A0A6J4L1U0_9ACTN|nr:MAG: hypothetical protein AVDCRST_MAG48-2586 [uncultured Friedmanniella sp.]